MEHGYSQIERTEYHRCSITLTAASTMVFYVLRTGCQWKALPKEFGSSSSVHRYFQAWANAGFFERIWTIGLEKYDELEGIGWEWQSVDGCMVKAPLAREAVGHNPTDRGKNGHKNERFD